VLFGSRQAHDLVDQIFNFCWKKYYFWG
jgi:hypothetical protein